MSSPLIPSTAVAVTPVPASGGDDASLAAGWAEERYTAARRQYTSLYVESMEQPGKDLTEDLAAALQKTVVLATALRKVQDGDPEAVRQELELGPVPEDERARTTDRFTIADLHRAAAESQPSWDWKL